MGDDKLSGIQKSRIRSGFLSCLTACLLPAVTLVGNAGDSTATAPSSAELAMGQSVWNSKGNCTSCHGWAGDGVGQPPNPPAPSLRATQLPYDQIRTVVQCGRPGTNMPYQDPMAYTDRRCYGATAADLKSAVPDRGQSLSPEEIDAVAAYVAYVLKGRGDPTKAECEAYFAAGSALCSAYP